MNSAEPTQFPFQFTVLSAVYRAEDYLEEFIESVLTQSLGFEEHIQLILVDDGSPDGSGEICDRYAAEYPNNITVIHKENGGVSSARNAGIPHIKGKYVNFCDPDDILSENTMESVLAFYEEYGDATDIVSIPITQFGSVSGPHLLNYKFKWGTRLLDMRKDWRCLQLSAASAFFRYEVACKMRFNPQLLIGEDAEQIAKILIEKPFLGVVSSCQYFYRRSATSALGTSTQKKEWYLNSLRYFSLEVLHCAKEKYGYIPRFVQNIVAYDLQWKLSNQTYTDILDEEEIDEYKAMLSECLDLVDEDVWVSQKNLSSDIKIFLSAQKNKDKEYVSPSYRDIYYGVDFRVHHRFSKNTVELTFLRVFQNKIYLSLRQTVLNLGNDITQMYLSIDEQRRIDAKSMLCVEHKRCLDDVVASLYLCEFVIPVEALEQSNSIRLHTVVDGLDVRSNNLRTGAHFPITKRCHYSYCYIDGWLFHLRKNEFLIEKAEKKDIREAEKKLRAELWKSKQFGARKAVLARIALRIYRIFQRKEIWIVSDRLNNCGDNGEAFFRYLRKVKPQGVKVYYAINKGPAYKKMKPLGHIVDHSSKWYKLLFLACKNVISSHADVIVQNPFDYYSYLYQDLLRQKNFIFLQHGVIKDDLSGWLNKYNKNIRGFICAAKPEYDSIIETPTYFYTPREVWLTGLARFDRLYKNEKKYITIMPTWRRSLMEGMDRETGVWSESSAFTDSDYFRFYNALINNERLLMAAKQYGYTICYMPHPNIIERAELFDRHPDVKFFTSADEYRDVYAESNLILTDYSSAVFDFAYLRKPVVYAQFDKEEFFGGSHVYTKGYFDYERDGFGEVLYDLDSTVESLIDYMKSGCQLKDVYRERIDKFFAFNDQNNCQRILDKILEMKD